MNMLMDVVLGSHLLISPQERRFSSGNNRPHSSRRNVIRNAFLDCIEWFILASVCICTSETIFLYMEG